MLLLTEWRDYAQLCWQALASLIRQPAWVFDARRVADPDAMSAAGLNHLCVGLGVLVSIS